MFGAAERLTEPGCGIRADSQEPFNQACLAQVPYPVQAFADRDSHRRRLRLAGQCGEFLYQLVSLGVLNFLSLESGRPYRPKRETPSRTRG